MTSTALTIADLKVKAGEPRVLDLRLGELLGFSRAANVRKIIRRNVPELQLHGRLVLHGGASISGKGRVAQVDEFYLNEAQAILVAMFSRTPKAAEVRAQVIAVFLAWRRGEAMPAPTDVRRAPRVNARWSAGDNRLRQLERVLDMQPRTEGAAFAKAMARVPTVLFLDDDNGRKRHQRRPRWWGDFEVREAAIALHRQMTIDSALMVMWRQFGEERTPSRSSLGRFWLTLDTVFAAS